jgi:hypothetical protein
MNTKFIIERIVEDYLKGATPDKKKYFIKELENFAKKQKEYGYESACMVAEDYDKNSTSKHRVSDLIRVQGGMLNKKQIRANEQRVAYGIDEVMDVAELVWASDFERGNYRIPGPCKKKFLEQIKGNFKEQKTEEYFSFD